MCLNRNKDNNLAGYLFLTFRRLNMSSNITYELVNPPLTFVTDLRPALGCDPEFFFKSDGEVIGSEKVIPKGGIIVNTSESYDGKKIDNKFIIDGVQAELNPIPSTCRAILGGNISTCFATLKIKLKDHKDVSIDFGRTVEISEKNLMELQESSRTFGCAPSKSIYDIKSGLKIDKIDPVKYRTRAAGGHIHIGHSEEPNVKRALTTDHAKTVQMLDIICGNTSVLIDRDKGNIERRKVYGRAGEFRQPKHGLEYRTLSNYWLQAYPLMSFAMGMARLAVCTIADPKNHELFYNEFTSKVKSSNIHNAINNNDFDLAMENFLAIEDLIKDVAVSNNGSHPVNATNLKEFHHFVSMVNKNGIEHYFKQDPITHWVNRNVNYMGFNDFLVSRVRQEIKSLPKKAA